MEKLILLIFLCVLFLVPFVCSGRSTWVSLKIENEVIYTDLSYQSKVSKGHIKLLIDTGTNELWVPSESCDKHRSWCVKKTKFDPKQSPTYRATNRTFSTTLTDGRITGRVGINEFQIGIDNFKDMEFGEALKSSGDIDYFVYDGVLGLGPLKRSKVGTTYLQRLLDSGIVDNAVFYFHLADTSGYLSIGAIDHQMYRGPMVWCRIVREDRWQIKANTISLGTTTLCTNNCNVEFDTGLDMIVAPSEDVSKLDRLFNATEIGGTSIRAVECQAIPSFPDIVFTVGGVDISLAPKDYTYRYIVRSYELCFLTVVPLEGTDRWILGAPVHRSLHVLYDFGKSMIGLAHLA